MSSNNNNGNSVSDQATNIITYIGVPLAVLGVLPILYNTLATLAALSKIKRMLKHCKLTALTRSDVVNRVIEVELPRYAVQPWDRFNHRDEYWQLSRAPSSIPGGSWTTFNWKTNTIGIKTQRVEYADQLRQPQVEIAFDELVAYMLDLGAVPDAHGWKLLRSTGLWTPTGCALMKSPDNISHALSIASLDDSDGHLSLKVTWEGRWTTRDVSHLPPYWIRLHPPLPRNDPEEEEASGSKDSNATDPAETKEGADEADAKGKGGDYSPKESLDSIEKQANRNAISPITCQFSIDGLVAALSQNEGPLVSSLNVQSLYVEHLRLSGGNLHGAWFASAATAYGTSSQTVLWNYKIPDEILSFARKDTVPCGVMEELFIVDSSQTPEWATEYNEGLESHNNFVRRNQEQRFAMQAEAQMNPVERQAAQRLRQQREMTSRMNDMQDEMRVRQQRRETRRREAVSSPKWDNKLVAEHNLKHLKKRGEITNPDAGIKEIVGETLHRMVLDGEFAKSMFKVLDLWKAWVDNGGMRISDMDELNAHREDFCTASLMVALMKDATGVHEGSLSLDLQECLRMWRIVRLG
ncbi:hypothetical protein F5Y16DRAFT_374602 [Xylariaceae sp. FL0255]|nr:hypothetical protein F5Y16DRAFT_374602 [Xylariaceae sp. FL0255]